jgi:hypothetical protein
MMHRLLLTEMGDFNMIASMDAASCFILSTLSVSAMAVLLTELESKELLKNGWIHKQELRKTLIIPNHLVANLLQIEAESYGITLVRVLEDQLMLFIGEARTGFKEHLGGNGMQ